VNRFKIRNFSIIAHIDHGKSTLSDRILQLTGTISDRDMVDQVLDSMDLERERGITIKLQAVRLQYRSKGGEDYILNLIDTPGHVDFSYEVSRSLAACEGAVLVVDATQGVEAQTIANLYLALENNLEIIPVINKIDLPSADIDKVKKELEDILGLNADGAILTSAKEGRGVEELLEAIIDRIPPPQGDIESPLQALIFDSHYDSYRGVIPYFRVLHGELKKGMQIRMMASGKEFEVDEVGVFRPLPTPVDSLGPGEVGFIAAGIKNVRNSRVGDTITSASNPAPKPLPGYRKVNPMVFCGLFPVENADYNNLRDALDKLYLNDSALIYEPETSEALGFGFRCGFLGLLHMEIVQERLKREYGIELVATAPNVIYRIKSKGEEKFVDNPAKVPRPGELEAIAEPFVSADIFAPQDYIGPVMELCQERRGKFKSMEYINELRVMISYEIPLSEIIFDFFDQLKSRTRGYASLDYQPVGYREEDLVRVDILVGGEPLDALSFVTHRDQAQRRGKEMVQKLRKLIPRHLFEVSLQAAIGSKVIARENIAPLKKNVLAKCYGGDVTRKRKLLEKQKEGKRKMKMVGNVEIPPDAFIAVLKME